MINTTAEKNRKAMGNFDEIKCWYLESYTNKTSQKIFQVGQRGKTVEIQTNKTRTYSETL